MNNSYTKANGLDRLTGTFSRDQEFCQALATANGPEVARILVYVRWANHYIPPIQVELEGLVSHHFASDHRTDAGFWTLALLGATMKDIGIIGYLIVRGLVWDAGYAARRSLENIGVLTSLWFSPEKAASLKSTESKAFRRAFRWESDKKANENLKSRGIQKRFEFCSMAPAASQLYFLLSKYTIHGGMPDTLATAEIEPSEYSCMFVNRPDPISKDISRDITIMGNACEIMATEISYVIEAFHGRYGLPSSKASEGGKFLFQLVDKSSGHMAEVVKDTLARLRWDSGVPLE